MMEFKPFSKIPRLSREIIITEKIDGTNASVLVERVDDQVSFSVESRLVTGPVPEIYAVRAGSRTRWITPKEDNHGFARWVYDHAEGLVLLGPGHHFGEWWGGSIQRGYGLKEKRFSLFNVGRWADPRVVGAGELMPLEEGRAWAPACCYVVPVLHRGEMDTAGVAAALWELQAGGSVAAPGFMNPEGVIVYHTASGHLYKKTIRGDDGKEKTAAKERPARAPKNKNGRRVGQDPAYCGPERRKV